MGDRREAESRIAGMYRINIYMAMPQVGSLLEFKRARARQSVYIMNVEAI